MWSRLTPAFQSTHKHILFDYVGSGRSESDQLPILAVTANVMATDVLDCLYAGMNGHIPKPVNADELVRQLLASTAKA